MRTLLVFVAVAAAILAYFGHWVINARLDKHLVTTVLKSGGFVVYDFQETKEGHIGGRGNPKGPPFLRLIFGDASFNSVVAIMMDTSPDPRATLREAAYFCELKYLSVNGPNANLVTDKDLALLNGTRNLRALSLCGTSITGKAFDHLTNCNELISIFLNATGVRDSDLERLQTFSKLKVVGLDLNQVTKDSVEALVALPNLESVIVIEPNATKKTPGNCVTTSPTTRGKVFGPSTPRLFNN